MKKTLELLKAEFESSSGLTPQMKQFFTTFKREFTAGMKDRGFTDIEVSRGHFYLSGFFRAPSGQLYYFSFDDLRGNKDRIYFRTAKHNKDWTGGSNQWANMDENLLDYLQNNAL